MPRPFLEPLSCFPSAAHLALAFIVYWEKDRNNRSSAGGMSEGGN
jgi:hypothetical protein